MIAIDSSALIALFRGEDGSDLIAAQIAVADDCLLSAASLVETSMVLNGTRFALQDGDEWLDRLIARQGIRVEPVTEVQAQLARDAFRTYGKGTGHPAQLNFGDCFSYALAKAMDVPLLYKGQDFARTDIASVL